MSLESRTVCVTGASGYIDSWLVKRLLHKGYTVKATVRDPDDPNRTGHLLALDGAKERLHLFKADLLEEGSFDPVVSECEGVFHTASPLIFCATDPQVASVRRIVLTPSFASVSYHGKPLTPDAIVDKTWFSVPEMFKEQKLWCQLGKTLAENAAGRFAEENSIDLVTINPGFEIGFCIAGHEVYQVDIIDLLMYGSGSHFYEEFNVSLRETKNTEHQFHSFGE